MISLSKEIWNDVSTSIPSGEYLFVLSSEGFSFINKLEIALKYNFLYITFFGGNSSALILSLFPPSRSKRA